jgi:hypothetical protein
MVKEISLSSSAAFVTVPGLIVVLPAFRTILSENEGFTVNSCAFLCLGDIESHVIVSADLFTCW